MSFRSVERKVKTPPAAQNWAGLNAIGNEVKTTSLIANFATSIPSFNYMPGLGACVHKVGLGLDLKTAIRSVERSGAPAGREQNASLVRAFYELDEQRGYSACRVIDSYRGSFRISRDVSVPVAPTFTIIENGVQVPVILCGWKSFTLDTAQRSLWMTVLESGLFSFGDYRKSPAEVVLFPEVDTPEGRKRTPLIIKRGTVPLLTESELREQAALYVRAQAAALPLAEAIWMKKEQARTEKEAPAQNPRDDTTDQDDLFDPR